MAIDSESSASGVAPRPVPWLRETNPAVHGSFDVSAATELGLRRDDVLDFSANGNVIGPSADVAAAIAAVDVARYPDRGSQALRTALADWHGVAKACVVPGNGSTELIWAIARAFLAPGDGALIVGPTYGEYAAATAACGARVQTCFAVQPDTGADPDLISTALVASHYGVVWLCHPNNPTGSPFPVDALAELSDRFSATLFVVDEAYLTLCASIPSALPMIERENVVVLRSLTKDAALAGLRVGYFVSAEPVADAVRSVLPPWSVSAVAQAAALAALGDAQHMNEARIAVAASREHLVGGIERLGYRPYSSSANFVLVRVGDGALLTRALLQRGFAVRDCASFGLPECIRIGVRAIPDQERLLGALAEVRDG